MQRRALFYANRDMQNKIKEKDRKRKNLANYVAAQKRKTGTTSLKQREAKQRYRAKLRLKKERHSSFQLHKRKHLKIWKEDWRGR